jgi:quinol monooxygenase YgiN
MIIVIATLIAQPGSGETILPAARICIEKTRAEDGCLAYDLHRSVTEPDRLVFIERWGTREALTAHSKQPHLKDWRDASTPRLVSKTIEIVHPEKIETF